MKDKNQPDLAQADALMGVFGFSRVSRFRNNPAMENVEFHPAADVEQGQHDLVRKSDADARDAMRLERIAQLEARVTALAKGER